ncbi:recombination protein NinG [Pseudomonas lactis]|uniref:recombination protein NinG n=1 Tax=Pseudomonas lactis TaxID=1615674 RepID=UPI0006465A2E|nr:recombination protein NinG [Pseudomonas lactis]
MTIERKPAKPKKCRVAACRALFVPSRMGQAVCSPACALIDGPRHAPKARKALADIERKDIKVRKEKLKSRADHLKDTQQAFNAWIRARDAGHPCISCGTTADVQYCAGHYRTTGSCPELRFEPLNVHLQCNKNCNLSKSGNILGYRPRLLEKIGAEMLAWIEGPHEAKKYTIEQLKAMTAEYRAKTRELKRAAA